MGFFWHAKNTSASAFSPGRILDIRYFRDFRDDLTNVSLGTSAFHSLGPALRRARSAGTALDGAKNNR
jgi:hypothetical protein